MILIFEVKVRMGKNNFLKQSTVGVTLTSIGFSLLSGQEKYIVNAAWYTPLLDFLWDWTFGWFVKKESKGNITIEGTTGEKAKDLLNDEANRPSQKDSKKGEDILENKDEFNIEEPIDDKKGEDQNKNIINNPVNKLESRNNKIVVERQKKNNVKPGEDQPEQNVQKAEYLNKDVNLKGKVSNEFGSNIVDEKVNDAQKKDSIKNNINYLIKEEKNGNDEKIISEPKKDIKFEESRPRLEEEQDDIEKMTGVKENKNNRPELKIEPNQSVQNKENQIVKNSIKIEENKKENPKEQEIKGEQENLEKYKVQLKEKQRKLEDLKKDYDEKIANFKKAKDLLKLLKYEGGVHSKEGKEFALESLGMVYVNQFNSCRKNFFADTEKVEKLKNKNCQGQLDKFRTFDLGNVNYYARNDFLEFLENNCPECCTLIRAYYGVLAALECCEYNSEEEIKEEYGMKEAELLSVINSLKDLIKKAEAEAKVEVNISKAIFENA